MLNLVKGRHRFTVVWGVDRNLTVSLPCDADGDVFVNSSADDRTPMSLIKVGDVGSAANKTDP